MINLVAGVAFNYTDEQIRPFLKSLRIHGYSGKILLFAKGSCVDEAKKWDAEILECPRVIDRPHYERFFWLRDALANQINEDIFLADTRDVIFQDNIENIQVAHLNVFAEDDSMTIGSCPYNSKWIQLGYPDLLGELASKSILCVGTTYGHNILVIDYLNKLCESMAKNAAKTHKDQSAHNVVIYTKQVASTIWHNEDGEVYTVGYIKKGTVPVLDKILNKAGRAPAIIHQWDRHPNLKSFVEKYYV